MKSGQGPGVLLFVCAKAVKLMRLFDLARVLITDNKTERLANSTVQKREIGKSIDCQFSQKLLPSLIPARLPREQGFFIGSLKTRMYIRGCAEQLIASGERVAIVGTIPTALSE